MMMKKIIIFVFLAIFLLIFFIHPKQVVAAELNCTVDGVSGQLFDENNNKVGTVGFGLTGGGPNASSMNSTDGSFKFSGGTYQSISEKGELTLYYTFSNDSPFESGKIILPQCLGNAITVKSKAEQTPSDGYKKNRCGDSCYGTNICDNEPGGCTVCTYIYNPSSDYNLTYNQRYRCAKPEAKEAPETGGPIGAYEICEVISDSDEQKKCVDCVTKQEGSWTALGCLKTGKTQDFIGQILKLILGIGGGIAFLLMIFGGLQIIFSGGNPEKVKAGKEILTAAISGLLLIIFSVFILQLLGRDILKIPGFK